MFILITKLIIDNATIALAILWPFLRPQLFSKVFDLLALYLKTNFYYMMYKDFQNILNSLENNSFCNCLRLVLKNKRSKIFFLFFSSTFNCVLKRITKYIPLARGFLKTNYWYHYYKKNILVTIIIFLIIFIQGLCSKEFFSSWLIGKFKNSRI